MDLNKLRQLAGIPTSQITAISKNSPANEFRRIAGMSSLPIQEEDNDKEEVLIDKEPLEDEELPSIVSAIASKAEGKTGDELAALIQQVYDAGVADGLSQANVEDTEDMTKSDETPNMHEKD